MKKVMKEVYVTNDGKEFITEKEARSHENYIENVTKTHSAIETLAKICEDYYDNDMGMCEGCVNENCPMRKLCVDIGFDDENKSWYDYIE